MGQRIQKKQQQVKQSGQLPAVIPQPTLPNASLPNASLPNAPLPCTEENGYFIYTVHKGDTLGNVAAKFKLQVFSLMSVNSHIITPTHLEQGVKLRIPSGGPALPYCIPLFPAAGVPPSQHPVGSATIWRTQQGDIAVTITGAALPAPAMLGVFDTYLGRIKVGDKWVAAQLQEIRQPNQHTTWCGTRILDGFSQMPTGSIAIVAFHSTSAHVGIPVLVNELQ